MLQVNAWNRMYSTISVEHLGEYLLQLSEIMAGMALREFFEQSECREKLVFKFLERNIVTIATNLSFGN